MITGGGSGIGRATSLLFAREGAYVVIAELDEASAEETVSSIENDGGKAMFVRADVSDEEQVHTLMQTVSERVGGLDVLVNVAGTLRAGTVTDFNASEWDLLMTVNVKSCFLTAKHGVPHMRTRGGGTIVNVSSAAGIKGGAGVTGYSASKGAVIAFTRALAAELAPESIRVNCLCPGWTDTPFNNPVINYMGGAQKQDEIVKQSVMLQRQAEPEEIASSLLYLASDSSSYMTSQILTVDGGQV